MSILGNAQKTRERQVSARVVVCRCRKAATHWRWVAGVADPKKSRWAQSAPPRGGLTTKIHAVVCFSRHLYRARNLVERFFNKIKQCRRVATRYDKLAANYLAFIQLASIRLWLRFNESAP